jgi:hypothetical protein
MSLNPTPLFYWINERHRIWWNKDLMNGPKPWTADPILQRYRFCNVFRELDKVTQWVRDHIRKPYADSEHLWHMMFTARFINWPDTLAELIKLGVWYPNNEFDWRATVAALDTRGARGDQVWTNAYTVSTNGNAMPKPLYIVRGVLETAWQNRLALARAARQGLRVFCQEAQRIGGIGGFMAYEAACDLRWCPGWLDKAPDISTWANAGPGAKRGLNRLHGRPLDKSVREDQAVQEMKHLLDLAPLYLEKHMPELEMRDIEHSLCETDKYLRVKLGEGKPRSLYQGV